MSPYKTCLRHWPKGLTLVETALAMALLGTLLVSVMLAGMRFQQQTRRAEQRINACQMADELLTQWWKKPDAFPREDSGAVPNHPDWRWRTQSRECTDSEDLRCQIVTLDVFGAEPTEDAKPAVSVDVLLPQKVQDDGN